MSALQRTLAVLELLTQHGHGMESAAVADQLNMPRSAAHRMLNDLVAAGYVQQVREHGEYMLTTKLVSMGLSFLSQSGIVDFSQPLLDHLASVSGELARLSVVDGQRIAWVARAQGSTLGLRHDPDMGAQVRLSCSSTGIAWMSAMPDDQALALVSQQGLGSRQEYGPNAPTSLKAVLAAVKQARTRGYAMMQDTYEAGTSAIGAPVRLGTQAPLGVVSISGPSVRFTAARMERLGPELVRVAAQLAVASSSSPYFQKARGLVKNGSTWPPQRAPISTT
jgi:IclR family transcriptional regulator, acetate operon repressor